MCPPPALLTPSTPLSVCRIKYILRQSDIFATHFGVVLSDSEDEREKAQEEEEEEDKAKGAAAAGGSPSKRRQAGRGAAADEMVDDVTGESSAPTFLMTQPPSITGGTLRSYQLEGLNWMVNLQAQGTNGELVLVPACHVCLLSLPLPFVLLLLGRDASARLHGARALSACEDESWSLARRTHRFCLPPPPPPQSGS